MTPAQLLWLCRDLPDPALAAAIALAESGGNPTAHNSTPPDDSYGLWQINMIGALGPDRRTRYALRTNADLFTPATNLRVARSLSAGGTDWRAWTTYTRGAYRAHLATVKDATMPTPGTAEAAIATALSANNQTETPPGSNSCEITRELDANFGPVPTSGGTSPRSGTSWCGSFTFWALWKSGYPVDPRGCLDINGAQVWDFYTPADVAAWKKAGRWLSWDQTPPPGALVYYDWQNTHGTTSLTDHVGLVTDIVGGVICTIEGNTSPAGLVSNGGGVYTFGPGQQAPARPRSTIVGYGLPLYQLAPPPTHYQEDDMTVLISDEHGNWFRAGDSVRNIGEQEIAALRAAGIPTAAPASGWEAWNLRNQAGVTPNPTPA